MRISCVACFVTLLPLSLLCMCRDFLKAYCLQLGIMANHQNGRDTHVRGIKVFAPQQDALQPLHQEVGFSTVGLLTVCNCSLGRGMKL